MKTKASEKNVPSGWQEKKLVDVCNIVNGSTPSTSNNAYWNGEINWYTPNDLKHQKIVLDGSERKISDLGLQSIGSKVVPAHSVILSTRAPIGYLGITETKTSFNQGCKGLTPKEDELSEKFLYYNLFHQKKTLNDLGSGSTFLELSSNNLASFEILLPPIKEQQKIAEILGAVDENIAKTQELIEATDKLKRGLMQQLFNRGIQGGAFEVVPLGKVAKVQGGYSFKSSDFSDTGIPVIRISNIKDGYIKLDDIKCYPREITKRFESFSLKKDDVLVAMSGATTGKIGIVKETDLPLLLNQRVGRFILSRGIDGKYLYNIVISEFYQKKIWDFAIGGAQPNVSGPQLESIEIPLPKISEQKEIAEILSAVDEKILVNKKLKEKFTLLKKGLMQDLLSGRIRING